MMEQPLVVDDSLVKVNDAIDPQYRHLFNHTTFNHMQSAILHQALHSDCNMVVAAPTGSGKTAIHEIAIIRLMSDMSRKALKAVYIAPNKALCQQRMKEWDAKFTPLGQNVLEVTGDIDFRYCLRLIAKASIIVTTPEKWDSLTRGWKDHVFLLGAIDLLLIDEVHHLGEDRGATLEALVVRMRMLSKVYMERTNKTIPMRIIALSATLPNLADIGEWLGCKHDAIHYFDETFRPVPLTVHTLSMGSMNNSFLFDKSLDDRVGPLILRYSEGRQVLVFCASKKSTEHLCTVLSQRLQIPRQIYANIREHIDLVHTASNHLLRDFLLKGVAYHHSGLPPDDRALVETLYLRGAIYVLCCTSTLAHGVNLPAHLVIIKGTSCWRGGSRGYERTPRADVIQMLGRAGRPGMDEQGVAVIMTSKDDQGYYEGVSLNAEVVESTLQGNLIEAICAEISQSVITNVNQCALWMKSTYFYVRVRKNPTRYGFPILQTAAELETILENISTKALSDLQSAGLIDYDSTSQTVTPKAEATVMTRNIIRFPTMKLLVQLSAQTSLPELLKELARSQELDKPVRRLEKSFLNELMKSVRFPLKIRVQEPEHKSYVLLQAAIARIEIKEFSLKVEQAEIVECGLRVLNAVRELAIHRELGRLLESVILLDRALHLRMWESNYGSVYLQCSGLLPATANSLILRGVRTIGDALGCTIAKVQEMVGCSQSEARSMLALAKTLHEASREVRSAKEGAKLRIAVTSSSTSSSTPVAPETNSTTLPYYQLVVYDALTGKALCIRNIGCNTQNVDFVVSCPSEVAIERVQCSLLSNMVGIDSYQQAAVGAATIASPPHPPQVEENVTATKPARPTQKSNKKFAPAKSVVDSSVVTSTGSVRKPNTNNVLLTEYFPSQPHSNTSPSTNQAKSTVPSSSITPFESSLEHYRFIDSTSHDSPPHTALGPTDVKARKLVDLTPAPDTELATIRRKAVELDLQQLPVKRLCSGVFSRKGAHTAATYGDPVFTAPTQASAPTNPSPSGHHSELHAVEVVSPERWIKRVTPARRSFFDDDQDSPVIPPDFDVSWDMLTLPPSSSSKPPSGTLGAHIQYPPMVTPHRPPSNPPKPSLGVGSKSSPLRSESRETAAKAPPVAENNSTTLFDSIFF